MIKKIFTYIGKFIVNPVKAAEEIARDEQGLWAGFWWVIIFGFAYSITVLIYYLLGHKPVTTPFLTIPLEKWYLVQTFTTIPVALAGSLSYGALAFIIGKAFKGKGTFEATFASQAYTIYIPTIIFMWIPETLLAPILIAKGMSALPWPQWVENLRVFIIPFIWIFLMSIIALSKVHKIQWWQSLIIMLISLIPTSLIMAVFIR